MDVVGAEAVGVALASAAGRQGQTSKTLMWGARRAFRPGGVERGFQGDTGDMGAQRGAGATAVDGAATSGRGSARGCPTVGG
jgi:hypothetical protein